VINATGKRLPANPPSYGHICKRINKLNIDIKRDRTDDDDDDLIISADSTGIKVTTTEVSGWMRNGMYGIKKDISKSI
jgi:Transposase DDE domain